MTNKPTIIIIITTTTTTSVITINIIIILVHGKKFNNISGDYTVSSVPLISPKMTMSFVTEKNIITYPILTPLAILDTTVIKDEEVPAFAEDKTSSALKRLPNPMGKDLALWISLALIGERLVYEHSNFVPLIFGHYEAMTTRDCFLLMFIGSVVYLGDMDQLSLCDNDSIKLYLCNAGPLLQRHSSDLLPEPRATANYIQSPLPVWGSDGY
ncbi:hypothetical protein HPG69_019482 [Diceros bicornis minor]|uniref:Uncharacterized protein n=1 Tax=Diceros bicornis minor TaxID=77932 RepID=A0A7J7F0E5_DICBM|nr:hypothetical protein HPG69_019482 [Diceros bicornis minor]